MADASAHLRQFVDRGRRAQQAVNDILGVRECDGCGETLVAMKDARIRALELYVEELEEELRVRDETST
jgi:transcription initiation factor IIE alpha subunit